MNENQKQATSFGTGGVVGFLLGWFLHKPKASTVGGQWELSNLLVEPAYSYPGGKVYVEVDLTNIGPDPASCRLTLRAGNYRNTAGVLLLNPGEIWHQSWNYQVEDMFFSVPEGSVRITVCIDPLETTLPMILPG